MCSFGVWATVSGWVRYNSTISSRAQKVLEIEAVFDTKYCSCFWRRSWQLIVHTIAMIWRFQKLASILKPEFGTQFQPKVVDLFLFSELAQVKGFWSWIDYLVQQAASPSQASSPKELFFLNLDETNIPLCFPGGRGLVVHKRYWSSEAAPSQKIQKEMHRGSVTHVAVIANKPEVQKKLPQVFLGNKHIFTHNLLSNYVEDRPENVSFWRGTTSWNTAAVMVNIIHMIGGALAEFPGFQPILMLDCAACHCTAEVAKAAALHKIWLCFIPAKLTHMLQPLDTRVFSAYKSYLRTEYRKVKSQSGSGIVTKEGWLRILTQVASDFLNKDWQRAFQSVGATKSRSDVSSELVHLIQHRLHAFMCPCPVKLHLLSFFRPSVNSHIGPSCKALVTKSDA